MTILDAAESFQIGRVVSRTFSVLSRNAPTFLIVALLVMLPVLAVNLYVGTPNYLLAGQAKGWMLGALSIVIQVICPYMLQAALVQSTISDLNGERASLGGALSTGFALFLPVAVIAILSILGMALGFLLLVVPGLFLITGWSVVVPVCVSERAGIGASFGRSWALTQDHRTKIFGILLIYGIGALLLGYVVRLITGLSFGQAGAVMNNLPFIALMWLNSVVLGTVTAVGVTAIYYELRTVKEGAAPNQLAAVFD